MKISHGEVLISFSAKRSSIRGQAGFMQDCYRASHHGTVRDD